MENKLCVTCDAPLGKSGVQLTFADTVCYQCQSMLRDESLGLDFIDKSQWKQVIKDRIMETRMAYAIHHLMSSSSSTSDKPSKGWRSLSSMSDSAEAIASTSLSSCDTITASASIAK